MTFNKISFNAVALRYGSILALAMLTVTQAATFRGMSQPATSTRQKQVASAGMKASQGASVRASGQGNPWINLRDGVEVPTQYTGAAGLRQILENHQALPTALASADFDEDGVPDLVSGYVGPSGGIVTLHRGNIESIYPNATGQRGNESMSSLTHFPISPLTPTALIHSPIDPFPFLPEARAFELPEAPDFLGAGDFDADGHWDVVAAARGGDALYLLPGDGRGGFRKAKRIGLSGRVTALVTGEINRADGLTDVVVGIVGHEGPQVLIFESPDGALRGQPEAIALPAEATSLALGNLDDDYQMDLAVAAGNELLVVHGRDRKLSLDQIRQAEVEPITIDRRSFPFAIRSIALGDFIWDQAHRTDIALLADDGTVHFLKRRGSLPASRAEAPSGGGRRTELGVDGLTWQESSTVAVLEPSPPGLSVSQRLLTTAKVSSLPTDDLVVLDSALDQLQIIAGDLSALQEGDTAKLAAAPRLRVSASLAVKGVPVTVLPMRLNLDALDDLVILEEGSSGPAVALTAPLATFTVNNPGAAGDHPSGDHKWEYWRGYPGGTEWNQCRGRV